MSSNTPAQVADDWLEAFGIEGALSKKDKYIKLSLEAGNTNFMLEVFKILESKKSMSNISTS